MKKYAILILAFVLFSSVLSAQEDLSVHYSNYANGDVTNDDTLYTEFVLVNEGNVTYAVGDTLYVSARLNGNWYGIDLIGDKTALVLEEVLPAGDSLVYDSGYLVSKQVFPFFPGSTTIQVCVVVWGKGIASVDIVGGTFPSDDNDTDNTTCVTYDQAVGLADNAPGLIVVYPNPANDRIYAKLPLGDYDLTLTDASGKCVMQARLGQQSNFHLNSTVLENGMYFLTMKCVDGTVFRTPITIAH